MDPIGEAVTIRRPEAGPRTPHHVNVAGLLVALSVLIGAPVDAAMLEEVVVTATKREESLQDVPISVTAFSAEAIQTLGFDSSYDFGSHVPNLQFVAEANRSVPFIFMRGIGNTGFFANSLNPVAIYVDQTFIGQSSAQGLQLYDLERVEVLRGPQGTLFGRNATGGLINFISRKPKVGEDANGRIEFTGGDFGQFDVEAAGSIPLGDTAAVRLALFRRSSDGAYDNVTPGFEGDFGEIDTLAFRGQIRWQPVENLDLLFKGHYGEDDSDHPAEKPGYIVSPFGVPNCPPGAISGALGNGCADPFGAGFVPDPDFYDVDYTYSPATELETYGFMLEANWRVGNYTITSLTSWDNVERTTNGDDDASPLLFLKDTFLVDSDWFNQELRLTTEFEGPLNWILGFNYYSDELDSDLYFGAPDLPVPGFPFPFGVGQRLLQETESWAVFGEATWEFVPDWTLRLGLRLTDDDREVTISSFAFNSALTTGIGGAITREGATAATVFPFILPTDLQEDWFEWSGRAVLDWRFANNQMVYASASRGFKGGQFNGGALFDVVEASIADPEFTNSYELGYKGSHFSNELQVNITGFFMDYEDQQVLIGTAIPGGFLPSLQNAGQSEIYGFEFDVTWQPTDNWYFLLGGGYLDTEFTEFFDPAGNVDRSGNVLPHSPEWNFNGVVRYETPLAEGTMGVQLDWWWLDDQEFVPENKPTLQEDAHGQLNARVGYAFWNDKVELALFVHNLTDEKFVNTAFDTSTAGFGAHIFVLNEPRTFGGQVTLNYD